MLYLGKSLLNVTTPFRAGVIPFAIKNNELYCLMAIDKKSREYCDFGGGVKSGESFIDGALRELHEESCEIFDGVITESELMESIVVTDLSTSIFFVQVSEDWIDNAETIFKDNQKKYSYKKYKENIGIKWIHEFHFNQMAFD